MKFPNLLHTIVILVRTTLRYIKLAMNECNKNPASKAKSKIALLYLHGDGPVQDLSSNAYTKF